MKKSWIKMSVIVIIIMIVTACQERKLTVQQLEKLTAYKFQNDYLRAEIVGIERDNNGFYIELQLEDLLEEKIDLDYFYIEFPEKISSLEKGEYDLDSSKRTSKLLENNTILIREYYRTNEFFSNDEVLSFSVIIEPKYHKQDVVFLFSNETTSLYSNGMIINNIVQNQNFLNFHLKDLYPANGLSVRLKIDNEMIYPLFSKTKVNGNELLGEFEFVQKLEETYTLVISRGKLNKVIWEIPFVVEY